MKFQLLKWDPHWEERKKEKDVNELRVNMDLQEERRMNVQDKSIHKNIKMYSLANYLVYYYYASVI